MSVVDDVGMASVEGWTRHIDPRVVAYRRQSVFDLALTQETARRTLIDAMQIEVLTYARLDLEELRSVGEPDSVLEWWIGFDRAWDWEQVPDDRHWVVTVVLRVKWPGVEALLSSYEGGPSVP